MSQLLHGVLEHLGGGLINALSALPAAGGASNSSSSSSSSPGCPVEALAQYFLDVVFFEATLSKAGECGWQQTTRKACVRVQPTSPTPSTTYHPPHATPPGPPSLTTDLTAAQHLLAKRICPAGAGAGTGGRPPAAAGPPAETPLAKSLLAIKDPQELMSK
jgi:hypothetical protein